MAKKILLVAALFLVTVGVSPAYAQYGPVSVVCSPVSVAPGGTVTCTASGFDPGTTVTWTIDGAPAGTSTVDANGVARIVVTVQGAGAHTVSASGNVLGSAVIQSVSTTVNATSSAPAPVNLPVTGSNNTGAYAGAGAILIMLGGFLVIATRKRRDDRVFVDA